MDLQRFREIQSLFEGALAMPPEERSRFLTRECSDGRLRVEVEELLLEASAVGYGGSGLDSVGLDASPLLDQPTVPDDYRLIREIGRGGMGVVYEATQVSLNRQVALKIGRERAAIPSSASHKNGQATRDAATHQRFVEEAQVGGQLQHPGIVPVYEVGALADERPYFTMKLVKGRTLATMLDERRSVDEDRAVFLRIFESVCQTMAYAHSKGVIHRDLKPSNVMVGAFGEVQVMDWGLSKVLHRSEEDVPSHGVESAIETIRSGSGSSASVVGNVLGTPAYMSPEQAHGDHSSIDERTDLFGLGGILCEILTGKAPYVAEGGGPQLIRKAAAADLGGMRERLNKGNAAVALQDLCLRCLMPAQADRPESASGIADVVGGHLSQAEQRAHDERLSAERHKRRAQLIVFVGAISVLLIAGAALGTWLSYQQHLAHQSALAQDFEETRASVLHDERRGAHSLALDTARRARLFLGNSGADKGLLTQADVLVGDMEQVWHAVENERERQQRDEELLNVLRKQAWVGLPLNSLTIEAVDREFEGGFHDRGLIFDSLDDLEEQLSSYRDTPLGVELALGLDSWARMLRTTDGVGWTQEEFQRTRARSRKLAGIAISLDDDPRRTQIRHALMEGEVAELVELASDEALLGDVDALPLLSSALLESGQLAVGLQLATNAANRHLSSFRLQLFAALYHFLNGNMHGASRYLYAARGMQELTAPFHRQLANVQFFMGDSVGMIRSAERAIYLEPDTGYGFHELAIECCRAGHFEKALSYLDLCDPRLVSADILFVRALDGGGDREELRKLAEASGQGMNPEARARAASLFSVFSPVGLEPEPELALDLLEPSLDNEPTDPVYWLAIAAAYVLRDEPAAARQTARQAEVYAQEDRQHRAVGKLLRAAACALAGDRARADGALAEARRIRTELVSGSQTEWDRGLMELAFSRFEPIAQHGR